MADADAKAPPKSNLDADLIASISPSSTSSGARNAAEIESQLADLAISDELPKPSGWGDDAFLGIAGSDEITGEITGGKVQPVATADSRPRFPQRHAEPDCTYYLKFGTCRFGMKCKFNHPARKKKNRVGILGLGLVLRFSLLCSSFFVFAFWGIFVCFRSGFCDVDGGLVVLGWVKGRHPFVVFPYVVSVRACVWLYAGESEWE